MCRLKKERKETSDKGDAARAEDIGGDDWFPLTLTYSDKSQESIRDLRYDDSFDCSSMRETRVKKGGRRRGRMVSS